MCFDIFNHISVCTEIYVYFDYFYHHKVFVRELISNSSDALEKLRYMQTQGETVCDAELPLEIHIAADDAKKTLTIQDTGVGLTREELISNLGTIARSGSKVNMMCSCYK